MLISSLFLATIVPFGYRALQKKHRTEHMLICCKGMPCNNETLSSQDQERAERLLGKPEIIEAINNRKQSVLEKEGFVIHPTFWGNIVAEHKDLPGWMIKGPKPKMVRALGFLSNVFRVQGAQQIRMCIKHHHVEDALMVPEKHLFHYPNKPLALSDENYCVLAQKVAVSDKPLTALPRKQAHDLLEVIDESGYFDPRMQNFCMTQDGKIALIDTELFSENTTINAIVGTFLDISYRIMKVHIENALYDGASTTTA